MLKLVSHLFIVNNSATLKYRNKKNLIRIIMLMIPYIFYVLALICLIKYF